MGLECQLLQACQCLKRPCQCTSAGFPDCPEAHPGPTYKLSRACVASLPVGVLQDLVCQICVTIADRGVAQFALGNLIVELMGSDGNWEAIMIGLKALLSIYMAAPARTLATSHAQVCTPHASSFIFIKSPTIPCQALLPVHCKSGACSAGQADL